MVSDFQPGDRVLVTDLTLAQLRLVYFEATGEKAPSNHHGTVETADGDLVAIRLDQSGLIETFPVAEVRRLVSGRQ